MSKRLKRTIITICAMVGALAVCAALSYFKVIHPNKLFVSRYEVKGVDVSSYQGEISWAMLATQDVSFAYIKATEGSGFTDECFAYNYEEARKYGIRPGAYHFFSFDSPGATQADNFISAVPKTEGSLPPAIDLEFYNGYEKDPPKREKVLPELGDLALKLERHYGTRPVLYVTRRSYRLYIKDSEFEDYPLWIRDVYKPVISPDNWVFWQYADDGELDGYNGEEDKIDLNAFNGTKEELDALCGVALDN